MPMTRHAALLICIGLAACSAATDAGPRHLTIATDQSVYHSGNVIRAQLVNAGPEPIYTLMPSYYVSLEQERGLEWVDLGSFWYGLYLYTPSAHAIGAGDSLPSGPLSTLSPGLSGGRGRYRFVFTVYRDKALHQLLPLETRVSNVFEIVD